LEPYRIITNWLYQTISSETGQDLAEYALVLLLIALAAVLSVGTLGEAIVKMFRHLSLVYPLGG
jgi:Flp pilus assembly pilin Flp